MRAKGLGERYSEKGGSLGKRRAPGEDGRSAEGTETRGDSVGGYG